MAELLKQGQSFTDTAGRTGIVNYDTQTGQKLSAGQTTVSPYSSPLINNSLPQNTNINASVISPTTTPISGLPKQQEPTQPAIPQSLADKAVQSTQTQLTDAQKTQESLVSEQMKSILGMNALGTEAQAKQEELAKQGYQQKLQEYQNLNSQILQKQAELAQDDVKLVANMRAEERRDTLLPFAQMGQAKLQGDAAIMRALKTSEIGVLNAQVLAKQGDIQLAQQMAQDAVDAKFAPYKQQIQTYTDLLKALDPILSRDEKKQANEQALRGQIALKEIDKISTLQSKLISNAMEAQAPQYVIDNIMKGTTIQDIAKAGKGYEMSKADKLEMQLKQAQLANTYSQISERGQTIKNGKPPTEAQQTANIYANRIANSNKTLNNLAPIMAKMTYAEFKALQSDSAIANRRLSPEMQQAGQAMRDFINATLRRESGAAIAPSEFENARKQYFPQWGDKKAVLDQKAKNREVVEKGLIQAAGNAYVNLTPVEQKQSFWNNVDKTLSGSNIYQQAGYDLN